MASAVLMERPLLVSSACFYIFQSWDKMLQFMPIGCMLPCSPCELRVLRLRCLHEQEETFHLLGHRSCCLISFKVVAAEGLTNQPFSSCH